MIVKLLAASTVLLSGVFGVHIWSDSQTYEVTAYFVSAEGVVPRNDVILGGVPVGTVKSVSVAPDASGPAGAQIVMQIQPRFAPLREGTRAEIRPKGLLGTMFVELQPSSAGRPIPARGTIPVQDTAAPVTLDQVNDIFDPQTREKVKVLTREGGKSLVGRGADLNKLLGQLPVITSNTTDITARLDERDQQLDQLQVEFDRVAGMMAAEDRSFRSDLSEGASLLDVLAAHQQNLGDQFVYANRSLAEANGGLKGHERDLNQLFKQMPALLDELRSFQDDSAVTLSTVNPCMDDIVAALTEMRSATGYKHPDGSGDANGYMLRVNTQLVGDSVGQMHPLVPCSGRTP